MQEVIKEGRVGHRGVESDVLRACAARYLVDCFRRYAW